MANTNERVQVKTYYGSETSSTYSSNDEEEMPYNVLFQNCYMISLQCTRFEEKYKIFVYENTELNKSIEVLEKKIQTLEVSLSQTSKTDKPNIVEKLRGVVVCLTRLWEVQIL